MRKFSKREYVILVLCVTFVFIFIIVQFVISPLKEKDKDVLDNIDLARKKLEKNLQIIASSEMLDIEYKKLVDLMGISTSEGAEFSSIISNLETLAKEANIHVANVRPQKAYNKEELYVYPVEVQIDGQWADIAKFLYLVQSKDNFYNISELNLEKYSDATGLLRGRVILKRIRVMLST